MSLDLFHIQEYVIPSQHIREYPGATAQSQEDILHLHVKQYTPVNSRPASQNAVTILSAHANGFPKELYEPLWDELYRRSEQHGFTIRSIWMADTTQQGMSSILNEDKLGNDPSWIDHSRDLLHMTNHFRSQMPRPIVGIGHSMGGNQLVNLSLMHPRLLTALVLLDPVIQFQGVVGPPGHPSIAKASTFRRDLWPSRPAAAAAFAKSPFYQKWDKRVFAKWIQHGLRDLPTAVYPQPLPKLESSKNTKDKDAVPVTLATTKHQEVWTFLRPNYHGWDAATGELRIDRKTHADVQPSPEGVPPPYPFYRPEPIGTFQKLPYLRPSVLYIFGETSNMSDPEMRGQKMSHTGIGVGGSGGAKEGRVKEVVLKGVGHLVPMEAVGETADHAAAWLGGQLAEWQEDEGAWRKVREGRDPRDNVVVDEEWIRQIGGSPARGKGKL